MKKVSMVLAAVALVLGLSQCKKQEQPASNEDGTVAITLDVKAHDGSRINVNPDNGMVAFQTGDVVYVASGQKFVGTLTNNGNSFAGNITNPTEGEPLYFYFLGNKTPEETLTPGSSTSCSVNISDQTNGYPVISFATSNETFTGAGLYTAYFLNKAALVKFNVTTLSYSPTCILGLNNKVTVDFSTNGFSYSQVDNGLVKLPGWGGGEKWAILLPQTALAEGDEGSVYTEDGVYAGTRPAIPSITPNDYLDEGIALTATAETNPGSTPTGAISGKFTINDNGDRVYFSQGNLQYIGSASVPYWKFADNQWDYLVTSTGQNSDDQNVDRDLFGWGTSGFNHGSVCYQPWCTSTNREDYFVYGEYTYNLYDQTGQADWGYNAISNGGNTEGQWRTLTRDEWYYVFYYRPTLSGISFALATVNNVGGAILLPNNWDASTYELNDANNSYGNFESNIITTTDWTNKFEANGAVFLPVAGYRYGTSVYSSGYYGYYWSSSYCDYNSAYRITIGRNSASNESRGTGCSVRLVHSAE